jgi:type IV conjugative transfer system protein TraL
MSDKNYYIPREINQNYVLIWKRDEAIFLFLPWILWLVFPGILGLILSLIVIIIVGQALRQIGVGKPNGYIRHWLEFNVPGVFTKSGFKKKVKLSEKESLFFRSDTFPPSHIRFIGG